MLAKEKIGDNSVKVVQIELESIPNQRGFSSGMIITESSSGSIQLEPEDSKSQ